MFKGGFKTKFCPGVNVLIGDNGTGKTTLLKGMYTNVNVGLNDSGGTVVSENVFKLSPSAAYIAREHRKLSAESQDIQGIYIPEKDILEHAKGLLTFISQKQTGFSEIYEAVLIAAQDIPTKIQSEMQKSIGDKIANIIGGTIEWDKGDGSFYTLKTDGNRIPFADEASGYKKLGFLGLLVSSGQLNPDSILFWDEPENSLNPSLMPTLIDILLELAQSGIQIFIATHDYNLARYFDVRKDKDIPVLFHNLTKTKDGGIACHSSPEYIKLPDNHLEKAGEDLYEAVIADAMGVQMDGKNS